MQTKEIEVIKDKIKPKITNGDYILLSKILGLKRETAVSKFVRNKNNAVLIMQDIISNREKFIAKMKKKYETI
jgi:hypothetical protein